MKKTFILYEDYKHMSAFEISRYYRRARRIRRVLCTIPFVVLFIMALVYGWLGWLDYIISLRSVFTESRLGTAAIFHYVAFAAGAAMQSTDDKRLTVGGAALMLLYNLIMPLFVLLFNDRYFIELIPIIFLIYLSIAAYIHICYIRATDFIKSLPKELTDVRAEQEKKNEEIFKEIKKTNVERTDHEIYDETKTEQVLSTLPKRDYEPYKVVQDEFEEIDEGFIGDIKERRIDRRVRIKDPAVKFKGDISKVAEKEYVEFDGIDTTYMGDIAAIAKDANRGAQRLIDDMIEDAAALGDKASREDSTVDEE